MDQDVRLLITMGIDKDARLSTAGTYDDDAYRNCHCDLMTVARTLWFLLPVHVL